MVKKREEKGKVRVVNQRLQFASTSSQTRAAEKGKNVGSPTLLMVKSDAGPAEESLTLPMDVHGNRKKKEERVSRRFRKHQRRRSLGWEVHLALRRWLSQTMRSPQEVQARGRIL